jgi:hypothetical protein
MVNQKNYQHDWMTRVLLSVVIFQQSPIYGGMFVRLAPPVYFPTETETHVLWSFWDTYSIEISDDRDEWRERTWQIPHNPMSSKIPPASKPKEPVFHDFLRNLPTLKSTMRLKPWRFLSGNKPLDQRRMLLLLRLCETVWRYAHESWLIDLKEILQVPSLCIRTLQEAVDAGNGLRESSVYYKNGKGVFGWEGSALLVFILQKGLGSPKMFVRLATPSYYPLKKTIGHTAHVVRGCLACDAVLCPSERMNHIGMLCSQWFPSH